MTLAPAIERLDREIEEVKAKRQALQSDIPDDLKADAELPLDAINALAAIRHLAALLVESLDRLIAALE